MTRVEVGAVSPPRRVRDVQGTEHRRLGGALRQGVLDRIDEHRDAERVGPEDEFLTALVGDVPCPGQHLDRLLPFGGAEAEFHDALVGVTGERLHDRAQPRVLTSLKAL